MEIFEAKERLLSELGWNENPFVKDLRASDREAFLKYYCPFEANAILEKLAFDAKACMLLGPKGVGKTSALYFVSFSLPDEFQPIIFKEPPQSLDALATEAGFVGKEGIISSVLGLLGRKRQEVTRAELAGRIKATGKKVVFFVDEAHLEKNHGMYMEFKYLLDDVPNLRLVISALSRDGFPDSLVHLVGEHSIFQRKLFSEKEMREIIEHRIRAVGGQGVKPFPEPFLEEVFTEQNLLTPRYVFDELNSFLAELALGKSKWKGAAEYANDPLVQAAISGSRITTAHADWWVMLSPSQQAVIELLIRRQTGMTLSDVTAATKLSDNTAFNALYQLRGDDKAELARKPEVPFPLVEVKTKLVGGRKKNIYFINEKVKNLFTMH